MRTPPALKRLLYLLLGVAALAPAGGPGRPAHAQPSPPRVLIIDETPPSPERRAWVAGLAAQLRRTLASSNLAARVQTAQSAGEAPPRDLLSPQQPLILTVEPCDAADCALRLTFWVNTAPEHALLSPALQTRLLNARPPSLRHATLASQAAGAHQRAAELASGLFGYAAGDCAAALPHLQALWAQGPGSDARSAVLEGGHLVDFYAALCLHAGRDYSAALRVLTGDARAAMRQNTSEGPPHMLLLWDAYIADSLAQSFAFDRALAWDDRNILVARAHHNPADAQADQLLAELYLLRGQHRLYLYKWDAVLADYNRALSLAHAPPRAYYYRGLLYYTRNELQAAHDDLTRYLALEIDAASPLVALARQYLDDLAHLAVTPSPDPEG